MSATQQKEITVKLNVPKPHQNAKIDVAKAVEMRLRGLTLEEIGNQFGATKGAVHQAISKYCPDAMDVRVYKHNESDLITALKSKVLYSMNDEKIDGMSGLQAVTAFGILTDKQRLIDGKSTANIESVINSAMDLANEKDGI